MENRIEPMGNNFVKIVCPRADELSVIVNNVRCEECGLSFSNEPRLRMHVLKIHEHKNLKKNIKEDVRYHCPEIMCVYALKSQRYFATMKYLKQHYLKVHAAKKFACTRCDKSFSTEAARLAHRRICGVRFACDCLRIFGTYEALLTHGKRAGHTIDDKYKRTLARNRLAKSPPATAVATARSPPKVVSSRRGNKPVSILPNRTDSLFPGETRMSLGAAVQTDEVKRPRSMPPGSPTKACKRRESRETQTSPSSRDKRARKTAETQTFRGNGGRTCGQTSAAAAAAAAAAVVDESTTTRRRKVERASFVKELALHENFTSENLFPTSPLAMRHDVALQDFWEEKNASLGTQTSPEKDLLEALRDSGSAAVTQTVLASAFYSHEVQVNCLNMVENSCYPFETRDRVSRSDPMLTIGESFADRCSSSSSSSSIETQTELANRRRDDDDERNFALSSNNETQTTENFDDIEQLLYSNTCTQTCNDILPSDLGLSDIQTQTAWPELDSDATISAETQTNDCVNEATGLESAVATSRRSWLNTRISHTETQTDLLSLFDDEFA